MLLQKYLLASQSRNGSFHCLLNVLILIAIARRSMKCPNALAVCVWPSLGWERQRLPFTSGLLQSIAFLLGTSVCFLLWVPSAGLGGKVCVVEECWWQNWE